MLNHLIHEFSLEKNSKIFEYIVPILNEHSKILENFLQIWYKIFDVKLRENLRDGNIFIELYENEKFEDIMQNLWGSECVLQMYFSHPKSDNFDGPWSIIKIEFSHYTFSGVF